MHIQGREREMAQVPIPAPGSDGSLGTLYGAWLWVLARNRLVLAETGEVRVATPICMRGSRY